MGIYIEKDRAQKDEACFSCGYPFETGENVLSDQHSMVFCSMPCVKIVYKQATIHFKSSELLPVGKGAN